MTLYVSRFNSFNTSCVSGAISPAYKAVVVIVLVVISAPTVKEWFGNVTKKFKVKEVA